jgi:hypothetical protein
MSLAGVVSGVQLGESFESKAETLFLRLENTIKSRDIKDQLERAHDELSDSSQASLTFLAAILDKTLQLKSEPSESARLLSLLADASRDVAYRRPFGPSSETNDTNLEPKCVLGVAMDIISRKNEPESIVKDCLRLIANCCADEDDNRRYVIQRKGLTLMLTLPDVRRLADFVVPALYNVCINFEDAPEERREDSTAFSQRINSAEKQLAAARGSNNRSSIEELLDLSYVIQDNRKPFLADLIEMASRSGRPI